MARKLFPTLITLSFIFLFANYILGKVFGLMENSRCYPLLGCNAGFGGYDALMHFYSGILLILWLFWIFKRYPKTNLLTPSFLKNLLILISIIALTAVMWEFLEYNFDHFRIYVLHMNLYHPNELSQASNSDTMGDMIYNLAGSLLTIFGLKSIKKDLL
jgi:uncharacterized membrane protein YjdF